MSCEIQGLAEINPVFSKVQLEEPSITHKQRNVRPVFSDNSFLSFCQTGSRSSLVRTEQPQKNFGGFVNLPSARSCGGHSQCSATCCKSNLLFLFLLLLAVICFILQSAYFIGEKKRRVKNTLFSFSKNGDVTCVMSALLMGEQFLSRHSSYSIFFFQFYQIFFEMRKTITAHNIQSVGARLAQGQVGQGPEQCVPVSGIPGHDRG